MTKKTFGAGLKDKLLRCACFAFSVFFASGAIYADNIDNQDYVLSGAMDFIAESGVTNVYAGRITGTGPVVIKGGGTVAFSNPENDYTGGTIVSNAVFRLDADGCAGSGAITGAVDTAHVFFNCSVVPNDLVFKGAYSSDEQLKPYMQPLAKQCAFIPLKSNVTVKGLVKFESSGYIFNETSPAVVSSPTVTYEKGIQGAGYLHTLIKGRIIMDGLFATDYKSRSRLGKISGARGTMEFRMSSNRLYRADMYNADFDYKAKDVFPNTLIHYEYGEAGYCKTYLNGHDQTVLGFSWTTDTRYAQVGETTSGQCWTSTESPATIRIIGCSPSRKDGPNGGAIGTLVNRLALYGKVSLVMDVDPQYTEAGFYQDFSVRKSTTTGDLIISNGDFRVSGTASFPNVPNIYVGEGGSFTNASTKPSAFAGCTNLSVLGKMACTGDTTPFGDATMALTLGNDAEFSLPEGSVVRVRSLNVGGVAMPDEVYGDGGIPLAQIKQGSVVVRSGNLYVDCEKGNDTNIGIKARPFKTIKAATDVARSGDTIHVSPGIYGELEGAQSATSKVGSRVVIPEGVTIEATEGPEKTFIVGAEATGDQIDNTKYNTGTNAVRCVYAKNGSVLRGFTLTGGRGIGAGEDSGNGNGSAFYSKGARLSTIENCIVSNNVVFQSVIYRAIVKNCLVIGNTGVRTGENPSAPAGYACSWYNTIIDNNRGHGTIQAPFLLENCTIGASNIQPSGGLTPQVIYMYNATCSMKNSAILGGKPYYGGNSKMYCTNCVIVDTDNDSFEKAYGSNAFNTIFTNAAAMKVDADYRPMFGKFLGIDAGATECLSPELGDKDVYGTPRVLNGAIDIGAVEYDWRPVFASNIGKRIALTDVSPSVTTNAVGGLLIPDGVVAGTVPSKGFYDFAFAVSGGMLEAFAGGESVGTYSDEGEFTLRMKMSEAGAEFRFVFTPDAENPGSVALKSVVPIRGLVVSIR